MRPNTRPTTGPSRFAVALKTMLQGPAGRGSLRGGVAQGERGNHGQPTLTKVVGLVLDLGNQASIENGQIS